MNIECVRRGALAVVVAAGMAACGPSTPMAPPPPSNVANTPPTIESLVIAGTRAEAGQPIQVAATVRDLETSPDQLVYTWSSSPGGGTFSFTGTGATTMWTPPIGETTPAVHTVTVTVTETYITSTGQPLVNTVSRSTSVNYNDSPAETIAIAMQFINDLGTSSVSPDECVRNFSDTCSGKAEERVQIAQHRADFTIESAGFARTPAARFDGNLQNGVVEGPCIFIDRPNSGPNMGRRQSVSGTCHLTTVYQDFRWYLCDSSFLPPHETVFLSLRSRIG